MINFIKTATMRKERFKEDQILSILKEYASGVTANEISRIHGVAKNTLYYWRNKYQGMENSDLRKLKQLEEENGKLKRLYANVSLENEALKDLIAKKL